MKTVKMLFPACREGREEPHKCATAYIGKEAGLATRYACKCACHKSPKPVPEVKP